MTRFDVDAGGEAFNSERLVTGNSLLDKLPKRQRSELVKACDVVDLKMGDAVVRPGEPIRHVYFPRSGYISLITPPATSESIEVGLVGREGAFGLTVLLDVDASVLLGVVQGNGTALRLPVAYLRRIVKQSAHLRKVALRYLYVLMAEVAQTAACTRYHRLDARLARWLLMTHDRAHGNFFPLTHEFLAYMLGVRRAGVTTAAHHLRSKGLIDYGRGIVKIIDRKGLEVFSCPCYRAFNDLYSTHLGQLRRTR